MKRELKKRDGELFLIEVSYQNQASVYSVMLAHVAFVFHYLNSKCKKKKKQTQFLLEQRQYPKH